MFKLNFEIPKSSKTIDLSDSLYLIGSCFSDEIGNKLSVNKFNCFSNPVGAVYNPISIFNLLRGELDPNNLIESHGVFYHWDCNGEISGLNKKEVSELVSTKLTESMSFLQKTNFLVITLGTAFVYKHNGSVVGNCHKVPSNQFSKELLSHHEIVASFDKALASLLESNSNLEIILTVSPVRHIRDGLIENNQSKSILIQAVAELVQKHSQVSYFPSYEIILDELRDYRFFKKDHIHPSEEAIDYVWDRFSTTYFSGDTMETLKEWSSLKQALMHRPFQPKSESHQAFLRQTLAKLRTINTKIDVSKEIENLQSKLI